MLLETERRDTSVLAGAEELARLAGADAARADRDRRLTGDVVAGIRDAGFARHFVPARYGGTEGGFADLTEAVIRVGNACAATAWCASLAAYSARFAAHLPEAGHQELWSESPDAVVATGLMPAGRARQEPGGWRLDGSWPYVSGVTFADWLLLCASTGDPAAPLRFFALPRAACRVEETWDNVGMRASGSHTVVVEDVRVPDHLTFDRADMAAGRNPGSAANCHHVPFQAVGGLTFIAPVAGAAEGALTACARGVTGRRRGPHSELALVRASGRIDAARHLVTQNAEVIDAAGFTPELMARNERNATCAAELLKEAVTTLVETAGTGGLSETHPLQRHWRDVFSASGHIALQYQTAASRTWSAVLLGPAPTPDA